MEARRQDLIEAARETREIILELADEADRGTQCGRFPNCRFRRISRNKHLRGAETAGSMANKVQDRTTKDDVHQKLQPNWREGGPPDPNLAGAPTTPYPVALGFFKEVLDEYSVSRAHETPSPMGSGSEVTLPPMSPQSSAPSPLIRKLRPGPKRVASETQLRDLIQRMKNVPNANQVDEEFARKSAELHLTYPKLETRWRRKEYEAKKRMAKSLAFMATDCFDRLIIEEEEKYEASKLREAMHQLSFEDDPTRPKKSLPSTPNATLGLPCVQLPVLA